jgi:hypothetical protein
LPSVSLLPLHPIRFIKRALDAYWAQQLEASERTKAKRARANEDARKREQFRKAHGIEIGGIPGLMGMKLEEDEEQLPPAPGAPTHEHVQSARPVNADYSEEDRYVIGSDGIKRKRVKRWFGIWE